MFNWSVAFIFASIVVLAVIAALIFFVKKRKEWKGFSPLAGVAFGFILAGIVFGEDRFVGYGLMGVGVVLAVADIVLKIRAKPGKRKKR